MEAVEVYKSYWGEPTVPLTPPVRETDKMETGGRENFREGKVDRVAIDSLSEEKLMLTHKQATLAANNFFKKEIIAREIFPAKNILSVEEVYPRLNILLSAQVLPHQESFKSRMFGKIEELKLQVVADDRQRAEISAAIKVLSQQMTSISGQISSLQQEIIISNKRLAEAQAEKEKARADLQSIRAGGTQQSGGSDCIIL